MATVTGSGLDNTYLFHQLDEYPWDSDEEFQGGLKAILGSVQDPAQVQHLTLRAKCYYYARKAGAAVDFNGYKRWVEDNGRNAGHANGTGGQAGDDAVQRSEREADQQSDTVGGDGATGGVEAAPKPASFAEICDMIAEGKPIPGIKDIPDTILEGQASESQTVVRKKPWEKSSEGYEKPSWMT